MFDNLRLNSATVSAATTACGKQLKQRTHLLKNRLQTTEYGRMAVLGNRIWYVKYVLSYFVEGNLTESRSSSSSFYLFKIKCT